MKIFKVNINKIPQTKDCSVAIGFFDGVHIGHQKIIKNTITYAQKNNLKSAVLTFYNAPRDILKKNKFNSNFSIRKENFNFIKELGINYLFVFIPEEDELSKTSSSTFVRNILQKLNVVHLTCGEDFKFGKEREASGKKIEIISKNKIKVDVISEVKHKDEKVSSLMIKEALKNNDLVTVKKLLGRPFTLVSKVNEGDKIGRKIGFRTANINIFDEVDFLLRGVFLVEVIINSNLFNAIANVGYRPTINNFKKLKLEIHIFNFNKDIYGEEIEVKFIKFIRAEKSFSSLQELKEQILKDITKVKKIIEIKS